MMRNTGQPRRISVETTLEQMNVAAWFRAIARREYQIGKGGASGNYDDDCCEETDRLFGQQSQAQDRNRRFSCRAERTDTRATSSGSCAWGIPGSAGPS